jgi:hypothetical protein
MARDVSEEGLPTGPPGRDRRLRDLWGALARRWPRRLRLSRPRITRLRLAVLGVIVVLVVLWGAVAVASTSIYSAQVLVVDSGGIGIPPPTETLDFGDVPPDATVNRVIQFENNGRVPTGVMILEWGGIGDLMGISDAFFTLDPGDEKEVTFDVTPPRSALAQGDEEKEYSGRVIVLRVPWWTPW